MRIPLLAAALLVAPLALQHLPQEQAQNKAPRLPAIPEVGSRAPAFRLNDHLGKAVRVGGRAKTWTVVAFYPKAMTPG